MYKVLLVDDDKSLLCGLSDLINWESYGFTIKDEALCSKEALKKLESQYYDLVITDIRMPGMDGLEFLSKLKTRNLDTCLMIMSTYNDFEYAQEGIRLGVFDYIMKPVREEALKNALNRVKMHLDEKYYLQQRRKEEQQMLIEENLRFFYPSKQEEKLIELMLHGNYEVLQSAKGACFEVYDLTNRHLPKTSLVLGKLLLRIREAIYEEFLWLETIQEITCQLIFHDEVSIEGITEKFLAGIRTILETVKKYELCCADSLVGKACQYVIAHIEEDMTLETISNAIYVSKGHLSKMFKEKTKINLPDYVKKMKMEHAKDLLGTGEYRNYEVSEKLGYCTPNYFGRLFKDYTGITPIEFRRMGS